MHQESELFGYLAGFIAFISGSTLIIRNLLCSTPTLCERNENKDQCDDQDHDLKKFRKGKYKIRLHNY